MEKVIRAIIAGGLLFLALVAMLNLIRGFRRYSRLAEGKPVEPIKEVNPPLPVVKTGAVELVGWLAIVWSLANLAILVVWALTLQDSPMLSDVKVQLVGMAYVLLCTILLGWGGIMLLKLLAYGRRVIAWGAALYGLMGLFMVALCLLVRQREDVPTSVQTLAAPLAVALAVHIMIDTAIGVAAQHVGVEESPVEA